METLCRLSYWGVKPVKRTGAGGRPRLQPRPAESAPVGLTGDMSPADSGSPSPQQTITRWSVADMPDLTGRAAIVTGANSGLGFYTAQALARNGASVTMAVRDVARGNSARELMGPVRGTVDVWRLDLSDLSSVRTFAQQWSESHDSGLDLLINNAGIMAIPRRESVDGHEMQFATNHLGHFALTGLLLPALIAIPHSRVVNVSSGAHRMARRINFDDLMGEKRYSKWGAYGQSKLANLLFTSELQRRLAANDLTVTCSAAHPGYAATNLQGVGPAMSGASLEGKITAIANKVLAQSPQMGALPTLFAATMPGLPGNSYVGPGGFGEMKGHPKLVDRSESAKDPAQAALLWQVSEDLTTGRFPLD
jgi:NAD(P)-dependent dehydrogenase (short-subunit alcohol dehydrogenase family)